MKWRKLIVRSSLISWQLVFPGAGEGDDDQNEATRCEGTSDDHADEGHLSFVFQSFFGETFGLFESLPDEEHQDGRGGKEGEGDADKTVHGINKESSGAGRAGTEEFEFVIEIFEASFLTDLVLKFVDGAGCFDGFDQSTLSADEVILVPTWSKKREVGGALVKAETADDAFFREALEKAEDGGLVALLGKTCGACEFAEGHGAFGFEEGGKKLLKGLGAPHAEFAATIDGAGDDGIHVGEV